VRRRLELLAVDKEVHERAQVSALVEDVLAQRGVQVCQIAQRIRDRGSIHTDFFWARRVWTQRGRENTVAMSTSSTLYHYEILGRPCVMLAILRPSAHLG